jgi:probable F420-dependent oxidoreductase
VVSFDIMKLGFSLPVAGAWATPENQVRIAQRAEALGYNSLWVLQRLLYALAPKGDYPPLPGQPWPKQFERVVDPVVTLAYVAAVTTRIRLGTSVLIMPYYTPILLAKQLATLDLVSGGRLDVGLGIGWSEDEYDAVGVPFRQRGKRGDEFLRCLKTIWTDDPVEFRGEFYAVPRARVEPRPVQKPHPPITIGGYGEAVIKRAVTLGDGFNGGNMPLDRVGPLIGQIKEAAERAGRDPAGLHVVCRGTYRRHTAPQGPGRRPLFGTLDEMREDIGRYAEAGLTELFLEANFDPSPDPMASAVEVMEALAPSPRA